MKIEFQCEFCGRRHRVRESLAGASIDCKECGSRITVPENGNNDGDVWGRDFESQETYAEDGFDNPSDQPRQPSKTRPKKAATAADKPGVIRRIFALLGIVAGVAITLVSLFVVLDGNARGVRGIISGVFVIVAAAGCFRGD